MSPLVNGVHLEDENGTGREGVLSFRKLLSSLRVAFARDCNPLACLRELYSFPVD